MLASGGENSGVGMDSDGGAVEYRGAAGVTELADGKE
jgi:hypothetical protein